MHFPYSESLLMLSMEKERKFGSFDWIFKTTKEYLAPKTPFSSGLTFWRELILTSLIFSVCILGTVVYFPSVYLAWEEGRTEIFWIDTSALVVIYCLFFGKNLPFQLKAGVLLALNFLLGTSLLISVGPESGGMLWLFPFPVLAGILFGLRASLLALLTNALAILGITIAGKFYPLPWNHEDDKMLVIGLNFVIANAILCVPLTILMRGLQESIERRNEYLNNLRIRKAHIFRAKKNLEQEIMRRIEVERTLEDNLREKEVLLHEIHHRVKNNLQMVSGMLNLQNLYLGESSTAEVLSKAQNRITAMAMIHDHLYKQDRFANVDMKKYLESLLNHLVTSYFPTGNRIGFVADLDPVWISMEKAIPCGLIVNELVSNSLKHAFPEDRQGRIGVILKVENKKLLLTVKDDGVGMPSIREWFGRGEKDNLAEGSDSLGLMIIRSLCAQLKAELDLKNSSGTSVCLIFQTE